MINIGSGPGAEFGVRFAAPKRKARKNKRIANHNAQVAIRLGQENKQLQGEVQQLRGLVGHYQGVAQQAQQQAGNSQGLLQGFQAGFGQSQASLLQGSVLGALGAMTSNMSGLQSATRCFCGTSAVQNSGGFGNLLNIVAHQHARLAFG